MASAEGSSGSLCCKLGLKPITGHNILFYYAPLQGAISYSALSINVMNPSLIFLLFPRRDTTNILLVNTLVGTGLYLYSRPHLQGVPRLNRILYSAFGAVIFSLGSVVFWAVFRSVIPKNVALCTVCGIGSGFALLTLGRSYSDHVDSAFKQ